MEEQAAAWRLAREVGESEALALALGRAARRQAETRAFEAVDQVRRWREEAELALGDGGKEALMQRSIERLQQQTTPQSMQQTSQQQTAQQQHPADEDPLMQKTTWPLPPEREPYELSLERHKRELFPGSGVGLGGDGDDRLSQVSK